MIYFKPFIEQIEIAPEIAGEDPTTLTVHSRKIAKLDADTMINNYAGKPLAGLKTDNGPITGFNFDVNDIRDMIKFLNSDDVVHISFGLSDATAEKPEAYTLVLKIARKEASGRYKFHHHANDYPWFEYSKPCPDICPDSI